MPAVENGLQFGPQYGLMNRKLPPGSQPAGQQGQQLNIPIQQIPPSGFSHAGGLPAPQAGHPSQMSGHPTQQYSRGFPLQQPPPGQLQRQASTPNRPDHQPAGLHLQRHASAPYPGPAENIHHAAATPSQGRPPSRQLARSLSSEPSPRQGPRDGSSLPEAGCTASSTLQLPPQLPDQYMHNLQRSRALESRASAPLQSILDEGMQATSMRRGSFPVGAFPARPTWTINELQPEGASKQQISYRNQQPLTWQGQASTAQSTEVQHSVPVKLEAQDFLHEAVDPEMLRKPQDLSPVTDSPPGMPTPPNVQHPPPLPTWHSDDKSAGFSPDPIQPDFAPSGVPVFSNQQGIPQQGHVGHQPHIHMPLSPFKSCPPVDERSAGGLGGMDGNESFNDSLQPHVVGVLETQDVMHPLSMQHGGSGQQGSHASLGRAISCMPDAQHRTEPWERQILPGSVLSRCNSAPPMPEVGLLPCCTLHI